MPKKSSFVAKFVANVGMSLVCLLAASPAQGQAVPTICRFSSIAGMAFGIYQDGSAVPTDTTTDLIIDCTRNSGPQNLTLTLALGSSATSGTISTRSMRESTGTTIAYNLYRDSARSLIWGQTPGADTVTRPLSIPNNSSASTTFTIFGRIKELQNARVGSYSDTVVATVSY